MHPLEGRSRKKKSFVRMQPLPTPRSPNTALRRDCAAVANSVPFTPHDRAKIKSAPAIRCRSPTPRVQLQSRRHHHPAAILVLTIPLLFRGIASSAAKCPQNPSCSCNPLARSLGFLPGTVTLHRIGEKSPKTAEKRLQTWKAISCFSGRFIAKKQKAPALPPR